MDKELFKDALYAPEIGKLMLGLKIGKIRFKVNEPYTLTVSIPNLEEAKQFLEAVGLGGLPFTCLTDRYAVKQEASSNAQEASGPRGTVYGLLKSAGSFGGSSTLRFGSHPNGVGKDCHGKLVGGMCETCAFIPGADDFSEDDYPWLRASKDV